jgi:hypothetical protein
LGHSNSAIKRLERKRRTKYTNIVHKLVSVTVVLSIDSSIDVLSQVDAVLAQTVHPEHLWLVVDSDVHLPRAISRQSIPDYIGFQVFVQEHIGERNWLSIANLATTKYTWIMTNGVQPGVRYLDRLLRLSQTDEYRHALIGTEGAILPFSPNMTLSDADDMVCLPQAIEAGDLPNVSVAVDMLTDTWLLRQEWIPIIMAHTTPDLFRVLALHSIELVLLLLLCRLTPSIKLIGETPENIRVQCTNKDHFLVGRERRSTCLIKNGIMSLAETSMHLFLKFMN